jgi:hypothetical protein
MFVLDQCRESFGTLGEERLANLRNQPPRNSSSPVFGCHRETINIAALTVPSSDHGTNQKTVDERDEKNTAWCTHQSGQTFD